MSIGSILGIPPLPPVVKPRTPSDVTGVFAAEFSRQQRGHAESREDARRGLESEEEAEQMEDEADSGTETGLHIVI